MKQHFLLKSAALAVSLSLTSVAYSGIATAADIQSTHQTNQRYDFIISAGSLTSSVNKIAEVANVTISYVPELTQGKSAIALNGSYTVKEALTVILEGTQLRAVEKTGGGYTLSDKKSLSNVNVLAMTQVSGSAIADGSAENGYVVENVSQVGPLQGRSLQDTPFSVNVFSEDLLENLQANTPDQMFRIAPTVRLERLQAENNQPRISMRGFTVQKSYRDGVPDDQYNHMATMEDTEQVEIFTGLSGFLYGANNIGGLVNYVTKTSTDDRLNRVVFSNLGNNSWYGHGDFGGKIDSAGRFGYRLNIAEQDGESSVKNHEIEKSFKSLALDAKITDNLWFMIHATDYYYNNKGNPFIFWNFADGVQRPAAELFDNNKTYNQPWSYNWYDYNRYGSKLIWDISKSIKLRASYIESDGDRGSRTAWNNTITSINTRNQTIGEGYASSVDDRLSAQEDKAGSVYLDLAFNTVEIEHKLTAGYQFNESRQYRFTGESEPSLEYLDLFISSPVYFPEPENIALIDRGDLALRYGNKYQNIILGDDVTISDSWSALLGFAHTTIESIATSPDSTGYKKSALTPSIAVTFKPNESITTYISYIEALEGGGTAADEYNGLPVVNEGEIFEPLISEQIEAGIKADVSGIAITAALFRINKSLEYYDKRQAGAYEFVQDGRQRHDGIELTATGRLTDNLSIITGLTWLNAEILEQQDPNLEGNVPRGVAEQVFKLRLEYDVPFIQGLSLSGALAYNGMSYSDNDNIDAIAAYTLFDLGARYEMDVFDRPVKIQADIYNLFDEEYWGGLRGLTLGQHRTISLSATVNF